MARRQEISPLQVTRRNGEGRPLLPIASDQELDQAIAENRYGSTDPATPGPLPASTAGKEAPATAHQESDPGDQPLEPAPDTDDTQSAPPAATEPGDTPADGGIPQDEPEHTDTNTVPDTEDAVIVLTPDGPGTVLGTDDGDLVLVTTQLGTRVWESGEIEWPEDAARPENADRVAKERQNAADAAQAATSEGIELRYTNGHRLVDLDIDAGHGTVVDADGAVIGWVRARLGDNGRRYWWAQDARGGAPDNMPYHEALPPSAGVPAIRAASSIRSDLHAIKEPAHRNPISAEYAAREVRLSTAQVRELRRLVLDATYSDGAPIEPPTWVTAYRRYVMNTAQMQALGDAAQATADALPGTTAEERRTARVLRNAAERFEYEVYDTARWKATIPPVGETDPYAGPYQPRPRPQAPDAPETADAPAPAPESVPADTQAPAGSETESAAPADAGIPAPDDEQDTTPADQQDEDSADTAADAPVSDPALTAATAPGSTNAVPEAGEPRASDQERRDRLGMVPQAAPEPDLPESAQAQGEPADSDREQLDLFTITTPEAIAPPITPQATEGPGTEALSVTTEHESARKEPARDPSETPATAERAHDRQVPDAASSPATEPARDPRLSISLWSEGERRVVARIETNDVSQTLVLPGVTVADIPTQPIPIAVGMPMLVRTAQRAEDQVSDEETEAWVAAHLPGRLFPAWEAADVRAALVVAVRDFLRDHMAPSVDDIAVQPADTAAEDGQLVSLGADDTTPVPAPAPEEDPAADDAPPAEGTVPDRADDGLDRQDQEEAVADEPEPASVATDVPAVAPTADGLQAEAPAQEVVEPAVNVEDPPMPRSFTETFPLAVDARYQLRLTTVEGQGPREGELRYGEVTIAAVRLSASGRWFARLAADGMPADVTELHGSPLDAAHQGAIMFAVFSGEPYGEPPAAAAARGPLSRADVLRVELRSAAEQHLRAITVAAARVTPQYGQNPQFQALSTQLRRLGVAGMEAHGSRQIVANLVAVQQAVNAWGTALPVDPTDARQHLSFPLLNLLHETTRLHERLQATLDVVQAERAAAQGHHASADAPASGMDRTEPTPAAESPAAAEPPGESASRAGPADSGTVGDPVDVVAEDPPQPQPRTRVVPLPADAEQGTQQPNAQPPVQGAPTAPAGAGDESATRPDLFGMATDVSPGESADGDSKTASGSDDTETDAFTPAPERARLQGRAQDLAQSRTRSGDTAPGPGAETTEGQASAEPAAVSGPAPGRSGADRPHRRRAGPRPHDEYEVAGRFWFGEEVTDPYGHGWYVRAETPDGFVLVDRGLEEARYLPGELTSGAPWPTYTGGPYQGPSFAGRETASTDEMGPVERSIGDTAVGDVVVNPADAVGRSVVGDAPAGAGSEERSGAPLAAVSSGPPIAPAAGTEQMELTEGEGRVAEPATGVTSGESQDRLGPGQSGMDAESVVPETATEPSSSAVPRFKRGDRVYHDGLPHIVYDMSADGSLVSTRGLRLLPAGEVTAAADMPPVTTERLAHGWWRYSYGGRTYTAVMLPEPLAPDSEAREILLVDERNEMVGRGYYADGSLHDSFDRPLGPDDIIWAHTHPRVPHPAVADRMTAPGGLPEYTAEERAYVEAGPAVAANPVPPEPDVSPENARPVVRSEPAARMPAPEQELPSDPMDPPTMTEPITETSAATASPVASTSAARAAAARPHTGELPLWAAPEGRDPVAGDDAPNGEPDLATAFRGVQAAWADIVPTQGVPEDAFGRLKAELQALKELLDRPLPEVSRPGDATTDAAAQPRTHRGETGTPAAPHGPPASGDADAVNSALQRSDGHAAALRDLPEWQELQTVRGATRNLWKVVRAQAGAYFERLWSDSRVQGFFRTVSIRVCEKIAGWAQAGLDRLQRDSISGDGAAGALAGLSDAASSYSRSAARYVPPTSWDGGPAVLKGVGEALRRAEAVQRGQRRVSPAAARARSDAGGPQRPASAASSADAAAVQPGHGCPPSSVEDRSRRGPRRG